MHRIKTWQLFAVCVVVWSTTWHAITWQLAQTPPEVGVALRFALAAAVVFAIGAARSGWSLRRLFGHIRPADHALLAAQGIAMYGLSYVCVYHAERHVASGLVAVGFSATPLLTGIGAQWLFGSVMSRRFIVGGVLGIGGVALIFWPALGVVAAADAPALAGSASTAEGAGWTVIAVLLSAAGALGASRNRRRGVPLWPALGLGMAWGALAATVCAAVRGAPLVWPTAASWWLSLAYLALVGSVLTFACYLTLQERIGPAPTAAVGVATPVLALVVSALFEGYRADALAVLGVGCALLGNALMLVPRGTGAAPKIGASLSSPESSP